MNDAEKTHSGITSKQIEERSSDRPDQGDEEVGNHKDHEKASTDLGQRLFDIFTDLSLSPREIVAAYEAISGSFHSDKNLGRRDWVEVLRTANAYLGAALSVEADGGSEKLAEAREKAVELNAYFESQKACVSYCTSRGDLYWHHVIHSCVSSFMVFYGWADIDEECIPPEAEAIILEAWDELGIPRSYWKSGKDWTNDEQVLEGVLGEELFEDSREWSSTVENAVESVGRPGVYTGDRVNKYVGGYTEIPISPIEVRDIVRAALNDTLELAVLSKRGCIGNPGRAQWRLQRVKTLVEAELITERRVKEIWNEVLRGEKSIVVQGDWKMFSVESVCEDQEIPF